MKNWTFESGREGLGGGLERLRPTESAGRSLDRHLDQEAARLKPSEHLAPAPTVQEHQLSRGASEEIETAACKPELDAQRRGEFVGCLAAEDWLRAQGASHIERFGGKGLPDIVAWHPERGAIVVEAKGTLEGTALQSGWLRSGNSTLGRPMELSDSWLADSAPRVIEKLDAKAVLLPDGPERSNLLRLRDAYASAYEQRRFDVLERAIVYAGQGLSRLEPLPEKLASDLREAGVNKVIRAPWHGGAS